MINLNNLTKEQKSELLEFYNCFFKELLESVTMAKLFTQFLKEDK